jgi:hypothetical protein
MPDAISMADCVEILREGIDKRLLDVFSWFRNCFIYKLIPDNRLSRVTLG